MDDVDREILSLLQHDARNNTNAELSERVGVSQSTVGKRIRKLEESEVIVGYMPDLDYDRAGFPLRMLFVCSTPIADCEELVEAALEIPGVINVTELMTGQRNVLIEVVGNDDDEITALATAIDGLGITIDDEILVRATHHRPASAFER